MTLPDGRQVTIPGASLLSTQVAPRQLSDVMRIRVYISDGVEMVFFNWYLENVCLSGGGYCDQGFFIVSMYICIYIYVYIYIYSVVFLQTMFLGGYWLVLNGWFIQSLFWRFVFEPFFSLGVWVWQRDFAMKIGWPFNSAGLPLKK